MASATGVDMASRACSIFCAVLLRTTLLVDDEDDDVGPLSPDGVGGAEKTDKEGRA